MYYFFNFSVNLFEKKFLAINNYIESPNKNTKKFINIAV